MNRWRGIPRSWPWPPHRHTVAQVAVWLGAVGLCVLLFALRGDDPRWTGLARGRIVHLSVPWDARVEAVPVELFQTVRRGDVVALLDDSVLAAQIEQVEAEIARLRAEHAETTGLLAAELEERRAERQADERSFTRDAAELAIRLHEVQVDLEYDRALLEGLEAHVDRLAQVVERGHAPPAELDLARAEAAATARRVAENERLAADLEGRLRQAESGRRQHRARQPLPAPANAAAEHLAGAIAVQRGLLRELEAQRAQCILRSPFDGTIVGVPQRAGDAALQRVGEGEMRRAGEALGPGDTVVAVAAGEASEVLVYAIEGAGAAPDPGQPVELTTTGRRRRVGQSTVASVGPTIERVPERLWIDQMPAWGRPFLVPVPPGLHVVAGDRVEVRFP